MVKRQEAAVGDRRPKAPKGPPIQLAGRYLSNTVRVLGGLAGKAGSYDKTDLSNLKMLVQTCGVFLDLLANRERIVQPNGEMAG